MVRVAGLSGGLRLRRFRLLALVAGLGRCFRLLLRDAWFSRRYGLLALVLIDTEQALKFLLGFICQ
ncbi:hypothetical protein EBQ10_06710 [Trueperella pyogenes]|uniref:Uncharacterized protein n=1 Tax=Trueperella pyogenes TaxID=1661 RepID=A0A3Q9GHR8_9ACTO|nr:hypothetical protein DC090_04500 [Trueperella pyogenes]AWG16471.1 hypothetical protein DDE06_06430 [Trueperella pyogenes]AZR05351.1 hypothetical protein EBQ11_09030 [Trueperella pyogenes]AZR07018.1 hypothetical protein EBQ10_06710 [Trueperella pyogenes]